MAHHVPLITTIVAALTLAWVFAAVAHRIRLPPVVGYLLAGIVIGPFTPGYVADQNLANQLAELGVILLMFGVGLHFSLKDLLSVKAIAVPGALAQIVCATLLGMALAIWLGWTVAAGLVFGLALSVASTVVLLRALQEHRLIETERGRIAVGWLIVEDIAMVVALVLLPTLAEFAVGGDIGEVSLPDLWVTLGLTVVKFAAFVAAMLLVGKRFIPWVLHYMAHTGSRELFRLTVFVVALGAAYGAAELFGVSFALGAFFAGMILSESALSQQAAQETLPLRDAFAVLFFVSVGMLFDPSIVVSKPLPVLATILIILLGKSAAAFAIVRLFGYPNATALTISASLAQIGEFSFILAGLGVGLALLPEEGRDLILAGAIISILLNPLVFAALDAYFSRRERIAAETAVVPPGEPAGQENRVRETLRPTTLRDHVVLAGHGGVGDFIAKELHERGTPLYIIESDANDVADLKAQGIEAVTGNAADPEVIQSANLGEARCLLVAIPDVFEAGQVVQQARAANATLPIIARAQSDVEIEHLVKHGANLVVMGEHEIAKAMIGDVGGVRSPTKPDTEAPADPIVVESSGEPRGPTSR